jgi:1,2-diacylglycerol 3-alpha-glucosyltransferase
MRIGMMVDVYKPHISGITNYISLNKEYLEQRGHEVFVFTFSEESYQDDESNIIRSPGLPLLDTGYFISLRYNPEARKLLLTMDVAHVHHPFLSGSLALLYCQPKNIPIVFTNHTRYDLYSRVYLPPMADVVGLAALKAYLPSFCRSCNLVISPSRGMREVLKGFGVDSPIDVVPNGVDLSLFQFPVKPIDRKDLGIQENHTVLIYVGRLGAEKNLHFLLRSFIGSVEAYENTHLILLGTGPERKNLEDLILHSGVKDNIHLLDAVPYESVPRYLAMADAFVTSSVTEVHPLTVIEAMASGLPVLGIRSPGIGDLVQDGETGFLASQEDLASFTAKMVKMIGDSELRRQLGENARRASLEYDIRNTVEIIEERYQTVIDRVRNRRKGFLRIFSKRKETFR